MYKLIIFSAIIILYSSCGRPNSEDFVHKPDNLLEEVKMKEVLVDFHLAEEAIKKESRSKTKFYSNLYYYSLFEKHNISQADFDSSVAYYIQIPEKFDAIYANVLEELKKLQTKLTVNDDNANQLNKVKIEKKDEEDEKGSSGMFRKIKEKAMQKAKEEGE